jgi:serine/threonine protein kinase
MEYLQLRDLERHIGSPLSHASARLITQQLLTGIGFMHDSGFVHRDLKPGVSDVSFQPNLPS